MTGRRLNLTGTPNARDLGGLPTMDGRRVRRGVLLRSGALARLPDEDMPALSALGLACLVDLRDPAEVEQAPDRLPSGNGCRVLNLPVYDPQHPVFTYVSALLLGHDLSAYGALAEEGTPAAMAAIYRWFVHDEANRERFAAAVRLAGEAGSLPLLFHCAVGKDRTGWLAAVLLGALGVEPDAIVADYLLTNVLTRRAAEGMLAALRRRQPDLDEAMIWPVLQARPEYLAAAYAEADRVFGSFDGYLRHGLGVDDALRAALRANLLG